MPDTVEKFGKRIGDLEVTTAVQEERIGRLEEWVKDISRAVQGLQVKVAVVVAVIMVAFKVLDKFL